MPGRRWHALRLGAALAVAAASAGAVEVQSPAGPASAAPAATAESATPPPTPSAVAVPRGPLAPLPKVPTLDVPPPSPEALEALDTQLARLSSRDAAERDEAVREVLEVERDLLPAIHRRLVGIAESADRNAMKELLGQVRDQAKEESGKKGAFDYLEILTGRARTDSKPYRDLVSVVAMSRMLRHIGTVGAARELIGIHVRFGEFLRVDVQRQLEQLGDRAVAALVEAQRHPAPKISHWAARQLDALGKAIPGEAVQTADPEVLGDILRAYGRVRDPDAARLVISFANSERTQIREAARQAVVLMGEVANWQLRDTYESVLGKKPPREWSWERTARELFSEYDRMRLSQVYVRFEQGLAAERAGKLDEMAALFDEVLARSPTFERAAEMQAGYLAFATAHLDDAPDRALGALRRVQRLSPEGDPGGARATSLVLTLQAEELLGRHVADQSLVRRAVDLDAANDRARRLLARMTQGGVDPDRRTHRYVGAAAIALAAVGAVLALLLRRKPGPSAAAKARGAPGPDESARGEGPAPAGDDAPTGGAETAPDPADDAAASERTPGGTVALVSPAVAAAATAAATPAAVPARPVEGAPGEDAAAPGPEGEAREPAPDPATDATATVATGDDASPDAPAPVDDDAGDDVAR